MRARQLQHWENLENWEKFVFHAKILDCISQWNDFNEKIKTAIFLNTDEIAGIESEVCVNPIQKH